MALTCSRCGKVAKTARGMRAHLMGAPKNGGHGLSAAEATEAAAPPPRAAVAPTGDLVHDLFATLAANKWLPKYQFERRVDAILALFLPELLAAVWGWTIDVVVPELPLKKPTSNRTTNADYALYRHPGGGHGAAWVLLELKTDAGSVRQAQLGTYRAAQQRGMAAIRQDLDQVIAATTHREKYARLTAAIDRYPLAAPIELLYLAPASAVPKLPREVRVLTFDALVAVEVETYADAWAAFKELVLPTLR